MKTRKQFLIIDGGTLLFSSRSKADAIAFLRGRNSPTAQIMVAQPVTFPGLVSKAGQAIVSVK